MVLSVIISTSPGRQRHLAYCLKALKQQSCQKFEVIVCDDGSEGMADILEPFQSHFFRLNYHWRPHDGNISRSRNLGVQHAQSEQLVFLNGDVLLNPNALDYYRHYLHQLPATTLWGYVGCRMKDKAPSLWFPEIEVNWLDFRFYPQTLEQLYIHPEIETMPHKLAGGHHFAMSRKTFSSIDGFDDTFRLWGEEDVEFALRGLLNGHPMHFIGDAWAEHMSHPYHEPFHTDAGGELRKKLEKIVPLEAQLPLVLQAESMRSRVWFEYEQKRLYHAIQSYDGRVKNS